MESSPRLSPRTLSATWTFAPVALEAEPRHDEREVDVEASAVRGADQRPVRDHAFREVTIAGPLERFRSTEQIQVEPFGTR